MEQKNNLAMNQPPYPTQGQPPYPTQGQPPYPPQGQPPYGPPQYGQPPITTQRKFSTHFLKYS